MAGGSERRLQVVVALIGVCGALFGALVGGAVTILSARDQLHEARSSEARSKRAAVYSAYLDSANRLKAAVGSAIAQCDDTSTPKCGLALATDGVRQTASNRYESALNDIFVYGSDRAYFAARKISAIIPSNFITFRAGKLESTAADVDSEAFGQAYLAFQRVMCREVSADPRAGC